MCFNALRDLAERNKHTRVEYEKTDRVKAKQMRVLNRTINFWQGKVRYLILRSWRGVLMQRRRDRDAEMELESLGGMLAAAERDKKHLRGEA
eukprot:gene33252-23158_t